MHQSAADPRESSRRGMRLVGWMGIALWVLGIFFLLPASALAQGTGVDEIDPPFVECCKNNVTEVNLRAGPSATDYEKVGILVMHEKCKALGQSKTGLWIQIVYLSAPGGVAWVHSDYVILHYGTEDLPVISPPPTQVPKNRPTIDPTFASQFSSVQPTRLPTFTPATPGATITIPVVSSGASNRGLPPAMIILVLLTIGTFGTILSAMIGRR